jgi:hypothetical protein
VNEASNSSSSRSLFDRARRTREVRDVSEPECRYSGSGKGHAEEGTVDQARVA